MDPSSKGDIQRRMIDEYLIPNDSISVERLNGLGNVYLRLEKQRRKGFWQRKRNANLDKYNVMLILKQEEKGLEYDVSDLMPYYDCAKMADFYARLVKVFGEEGKLVEEHIVGRPTPAVFDNNGKQIAFSEEYVKLDCFLYR